MVCGAGLLLVENKAAFWARAMALGNVMVPLDEAATHFALSGLATGFLGPAVMQATGRRRAGMATVWCS